MNWKSIALALFSAIFGIAAGFFLGIKSKSNSELDPQAVFAIVEGRKVLAEEVLPRIQKDLEILEKNKYQIQKRGTEDFIREKNLLGAASNSQILWKIPLPPEKIFSLKDGKAPSIGSQRGSVHLIFIGNYLCPFCKEAEKRFQELKEKYKDELKISYRFQMNEPDNSMVRASAEATFCALDQGKFWEYRDELARSQNIDHTALIAAAQNLKLDLKAFDACYTGRKHKEALEKELAEVDSLQAVSAPSFLINGRNRFGASSFDELSLAIEQEIKRE